MNVCKNFAIQPNSKQPFLCPINMLSISYSHIDFKCIILSLAKSLKRKKGFYTLSRNSKKISV